MKYMIWGAGAHGKRLLRCFGKQRVEAFLDMSSEKQGTLCEGVSVVSPEEGLRRHPDAYIVVSPQQSEDIVAWLEADRVSRYVSVNEFPRLWKQKGFFDFDGYDVPARKGETVALYGVNLWSFWLYEQLKQRGVDAYFVPDEEEGGKAELLRKMDDGMVRTAPRRTDVLFVTNPSFERAAVKFSYCRVEDFWNLEERRKDRRHPELDAFHNIHHGERMFLVATGPSLRFEDLAKLHDAGEMTFGVNTVFRAFTRTDWRPDYYAMSDVAGLMEYKEDIKTLSLPHLFLMDSAADFWTNNPPDPSRFHPYYLDLEAREKGHLTPYSADITKCIYGNATVTYIALQIAMYMGFSEIYLLGADCSYDGNPHRPQNHFIPDYFREDDAQPIVSFDLLGAFRDYQAARKYAGHHGIKICNATRGGNLEVFPRVNFDDLF